MQTHCAESDWHCGYALDRFGTSDPAALDRFGLMRPRTVLAHSDHLTDDEMDLLASRRAGVAHCPLSNAYFANAVFRVRRALAAGLGVGLGSDIAGGARPGLLGVCQDAVTVSRMLEDGVDPALGPAERGVPESRIDTVTAFWLATAGGAAVIDLPVGLIEPGRRFDAVAVQDGPSGRRDPAMGGHRRRGPLLREGRPPSHRRRHHPSLGRRHKRQAHDSPALAPEQQPGQTRCPSANAISGDPRTSHLAAPAMRHLRPLSNRPAARPCQP